MRDTDMRDNDLRTTDRRRRAGSWVAPVIILALVIGVGWWVLDRSRSDDNAAGNNAAITTDRNAGTTGTAATGGTTNAAAGTTQTATGTVNRFDATSRQVTLDNGDTYTLA